jgi:hypothetical protein
MAPAAAAGYALAGPGAFLAPGLDVLSAVFAGMGGALVGGLIAAKITTRQTGRSR